MDEYVQNIVIRQNTLAAVFYFALFFFLPNHQISPDLGVSVEVEVVHKGNKAAAKTKCDESHSFTCLLLCFSDTSPSPTNSLFSR